MNTKANNKSGTRNSTSTTNRTTTNRLSATTVGGPIQAFGSPCDSLMSKDSILKRLSDCTLPDEHLEENEFNLKKICELCDISFSIINRICRHHCRQCNKSVCG